MFSQISWRPIKQRVDYEEELIISWIWDSIFYFLSHWGSLLLKVYLPALGLMVRKVSDAEFSNQLVTLKNIYSALYTCVVLTWQYLSHIRNQYDLFTYKVNLFQSILIIIILIFQPQINNSICNVAKIKMFYLHWIFRVQHFIKSENKTSLTHK